MKRSDFRHIIDYGDDFCRVHIWFMGEKIIDGVFCFSFLTDVEDEILYLMKTPNDKMREILAKNRELKLERINKDE